MVSPTHIYPGPVGVDIKCSMSLLQLNIPEDALVDKRTRRLFGITEAARSTRMITVVGA